jgi:hypothetical protein
MAQSVWLSYHGRCRILTEFGGGRRFFLQATIPAASLKGLGTLIRGPS